MEVSFSMKSRNLCFVLTILLLLTLLLQSLPSKLLLTSLSLDTMLLSILTFLATSSKSLLPSNKRPT